MIFDASRMVFGGFSNLVSVTGEPLSWFVKAWCD
jgi:hypothetical protein